jgi:cyclophilin family peptidyl-prolyl cis-trans isomerase
MARSNEPHSGTSQFYVNLADNIDLNPRPTRWGYAVFGKVVLGLVADVLDLVLHVLPGIASLVLRLAPGLLDLAFDFLRLAFDTI